jgi:D-alanine-D-alanine ligase-like ATP-grasp enzyme
MLLRFCHPGLLTILSLACRARGWYHHRRAGEQRSNFYAAVWRDAAARLGASIELLGNEILEIRLDGACTRVRQNTTAIDDPVTLSLAANKPLVYRLMAEHGLRIPNYLEFPLSDLSKAAEFIARFGGEWVLKPANGAAGRGVTTGISSSFGLLRAAVAAAAYDSNLVVEQQVTGDVYRLLYLNGTLLDAVLRKRPTVVGDGRSSIRKLVQVENRARLEAGPELAQGLISTDLDMRYTLAKQGFSLSSVPKKGIVVVLKTVINENSASDNIAATKLLCDSIIQDGAAAAAAVGVSLAGVDIVTRDPAIPLVKSGGVILEVNTTPGYHYHYYRQGEACTVAVHVLSCLISRIQASRNISTDWSLSSSAELQQEREHDFRSCS